MNKKFLALSASKSTVFSYNDLAYFFWSDKEKLISKVSYYAKKGYLYKIKRWLYALNKNYNILELATKIQKASYISLETALKIHGINFQYDSVIHVIWYKTEERSIDWHIISFRVIKKEVRKNFEWIVSKDWYVIADKYRAILDTLYLYKNFFFDNLDDISWEKLKIEAKIYNSKSLEKKVALLKHNYLENEYYS